MMSGSITPSSLSRSPLAEDGISDLAAHSAKLEQQLREMQRKYNQTVSYWSQADGAGRRERAVAGSLPARADVTSAASLTTSSAPPTVYSTSPNGSAPPTVYSAPPAVYAAPPTVYAAPPAVYATPPKVYSTSPNVIMSGSAYQQSNTSLLYHEPQSLQPTLMKENTERPPLGGEIPWAMPGAIANSLSKNRDGEYVIPAPVGSMSSQRRPSSGSADDDVNTQFAEYEKLRMRIAGFLVLVFHVSGNTELEQVAKGAAATGRRLSKGSKDLAPDALSKDQIVKFLRLPPGEGESKSRSSSKDSAGSGAGSSRGSADASKEKLNKYIQEFHLRTTVNGRIVKAALAGKNYMFISPDPLATGSNDMTEADNLAESMAVQRILTDSRRDLNCNSDDREELKRPEAKPRSCFFAPMPAGVALILFAFCCGLSFSSLWSPRQSRAAGSSGTPFQPFPRVFKTPPTAADWKIMVEEETAQQLHAAQAAAEMKIKTDASVFQASESEVEVMLTEAETDAAMDRKQASVRKAAQADALQKRAAQIWASEQKNTQIKLADEIKSIEAMKQALLKARPKEPKSSSTQETGQSSGSQALVEQVKREQIQNRVPNAMAAFLPALAVFVAFLMLFDRRPRGASLASGEASQIERLAVRRGEISKTAWLHEPLLGV